MALTIGDVAALVTGDRPEPPWLRHRLLKLSGTIRAYVEGEEAAPRRAEMKKRMAAFRDAAIRLQEELGDAVFLTFIGTDWRSLPADVSAVMGTLAELGNRADALSKRLAGRQGSGLAFPIATGDAISSRHLCAWTIMQAIKLTRHVQTISADDRDAWRAMNALYKLSGGMSLGKIATPEADGREPSGWREHIMHVRDMEKEGSRRSQWLALDAMLFPAPAIVPHQEVVSFVDIMRMELKGEIDA